MFLLMFMVFPLLGISDAYYCAECTRLEKDRDGCPKIVNLGASRTDLFYERRRLGEYELVSAIVTVLLTLFLFSFFVRLQEGLGEQLFIHFNNTPTLCSIIYIVQVDERKIARQQSS